MDATLLANSLTSLVLIAPVALTDLVIGDQTD